MNKQQQPDVDAVAMDEQQQPEISMGWHQQLAICNEEASNDPKGEVAEVQPKEEEEADEEQ